MCTAGASSECVITLPINLPLLATLIMHCCMSVETGPAWTTACIKQGSWSRVCPVFPGSMDTLLRRRLCLVVLAFEQGQLARKASSSHRANPTAFRITVLFRITLRPSGRVLNLSTVWPSGGRHLYIVGKNASK